MNIRHHKLLLVLILSILSAQLRADVGGMIAGVQVGQSDLNNFAMVVNTGSNGNDADFPIDSDVPCTDVNTPAGCSFFINTTPSNTGFAMRIYGGMGFNQYFSAETGLAYFSPSYYKPDVPYLTHQPQIREYAFDLLGRLTFPFRNFGVFGKGGLAAVYKSVSGALNTNDQEKTSGGTVSVHPEIGFGVSYSFDYVTIDVSQSRILKGDDFEQVNFYALGITYSLRDKYCGQFLC